MSIKSISVADFITILATNGVHFRRSDSPYTSETLKFVCFTDDGLYSRVPVPFRSVGKNLKIEELIEKKVNVFVSNVAIFNRASGEPLLMVETGASAHVSSLNLDLEKSDLSRENCIRIFNNLLDVISL